MERVSDAELVARFIDDSVTESEDVVYVTRHSLEHKVPSLSPALGATLQQIARALNASTIIEVGTGLGVTTVRLAEACPSAHITSIDRELDYHLTLKELLPELDLDPTKLRLITEHAEDVLPKMNEGSYDLVVIDVDADSVAACYEAAIAITRPGGSIIVTRVLAGGQVANPANRKSHVAEYRSVLKTIEHDDRVTHAIVPVGEGLAWVTLHTPGSAT